jgi:hypothetical protein
VVGRGFRGFVRVVDDDVEGDLKVVPLLPGDIVWVQAPDPNGANEKLRPWVVVNLSSQIATVQQFVGAAITTTIPNPISDNLVELPWNPRGTVKTGLRRRSAVVCNWVAVFESSRILRRAGFVPPAKLKVIVRKINELAAEGHESL